VKYYYATYTGGAVCIEAENEFPLAELQQYLSNAAEEAVFMVFWKEISKKQYDEFSAYLKRIGKIGVQTSSGVIEAGSIEPDDPKKKHH